MNLTNLQRDRNRRRTHKHLTLACIQPNALELQLDHGRGRNNEIVGENHTIRAIYPRHDGHDGARPVALTAPHHHLPRADSRELGQLQQDQLFDQCCAIVGVGRGRQVVPTHDDRLGQLGFRPSAHTIGSFDALPAVWDVDQEGSAVMGVAHSVHGRSLPVCFPVVVGVDRFVDLFDTLRMEFCMSLRLFASLMLLCASPVASGDDGWVCDVRGQWSLCDADGAVCVAHPIAVTESGPDRPRVEARATLACQQALDVDRLRESWLTDPSATPDAVTRIDDACSSVQCRAAQTEPSPDADAFDEPVCVDVRATICQMCGARSTLCVQVQSEQPVTAGACADTHERLLAFEALFIQVDALQPGAWTQAKTDLCGDPVTAPSTP